MKKASNEAERLEADSLIVEVKHLEAKVLALAEAAAEATREGSTLVGKNGAAMLLWQHLIRRASPPC